MLEQKIVDVLEKNSWRVRYENNGSVELSISTPHGDGYSTCVSEKHFIQDITDEYESFDIEEYVCIWLEAKRNGVRNVPYITELMCDATFIESMLEALYRELIILQLEEHKWKS